MKLADWARVNGVHPKTALRWWREGTLPVPARKVGPRTILVEVVAPGNAQAVALYARVSSHDQRADLDRQLGRLVEWATRQQLPVTRTVVEVGSGMNGARPKLRRLLADATVTTIVVEHRDRLARLGSEYIEAALLGAGRRLIVVEATEVADDLVPDMTEVLTSLCARLYGRRSARTRAARALRCAAQPVEAA
ncbi:MAG TPA: IS607 family transposase [Candidatus Dormibacteraeota bacterium]|nr:IS607 family transposase [Candidatus Dormibacteraeota bacterium]